MHLYAFILGRKPMLSIAEICSVLGKTSGIIDSTSEALIASFEHPLKNPQESLRRLGGTIKIAEIFAEDAQSKNEIAPLISQYLIDNFKESSGKLNYGVSAYSFAEKHEIILRRTLNNIKKELVVAGLKSRFINHNFKNLENAAIKGEKLLEKGAEIVMIQGTRKIFLGHTKALQDFENYSHRDYDRPARDPRLGMLPPKLAQMMINFGGSTSLESPINPSHIVYDPFVGIGTVLTEGLFLGYSVIGSDIDPGVIKKAQKNIDWTANQIFMGSQKVRLFVKDATTLTQKDLPETVTMVVTESYLGPPVSQFPTPQNMHKTFTNVRETVLRFFQALHPIIKSGTPVIISLLVYRQKGRFFFIENLVEKITDIGYEIMPLIPEQIQKKFHLKSHQRPSLIYDRPDQIVGREIWKFVKK